MLGARVRVYLLLQLHVAVVDHRLAFGPVHHRPLQTERTYREDNDLAFKAHSDETTAKNGYMVYQVQILVSIIFFFFKKV